MPTKHKVRPGESLLELAYEGGFESWKVIWEDAANTELREVRRDPQVLLPGDSVVLPDRKTAPIGACPVDKVHRFRLRRPRAWVNLRMVDTAGEPLADARYQLSIDGRTHEGMTNGDGMVSVEIRPSTHRGRLKLWFDEAQPPFEAPVAVGHLDPASAWSGVRARLMNLGKELSAQNDQDPNSTLLSHPMGVLARVTAAADSTQTVETRLEQEHDTWQNQA